MQQRHTISPSFSTLNFLSYTYIYRMRLYCQQPGRPGSLRRHTIYCSPHGRSRNNSVSFPHPSALTLTCSSPLQGDDSEKTSKSVKFMRLWSEGSDWNEGLTRWSSLRARQAQDTDSCTTNTSDRMIMYCYVKETPQTDGSKQRLKKSHVGGTTISRFGPRAPFDHSILY